MKSINRMVAKTDKAAEQYKGKSGENYHKNVHEIPDKAYLWIAHNRVKKINPFINEHDKILEYGIGFGWNIATLTNEYRIGYDLSVHLSQEIEKYGIRFTNDILSIKNHSMNAVICHHVLEHVSNPSEVLRQMREKLTDKGKLLLFVPYEKERIYRTYNPDEPNQHLFSWNVQTLGKLVEINGFKVRKGYIREFGCDRFASVWADKLNTGEKGFQILKKIFHILRPRKEVFILAEKS